MRHEGGLCLDPAWRDRWPEPPGLCPPGSQERGRPKDSAFLVCVCVCVKDLGAWLASLQMLWLEQKPHWPEVFSPEPALCLCVGQWCFQSCHYLARTHLMLSGEPVLGVPQEFLHGECSEYSEKLRFMWEGCDPAQAVRCCPYISPVEAIDLAKGNTIFRPFPVPQQITIRAGTFYSLICQCRYN